jgi:hypothetical protein
VFKFKLGSDDIQLGILIVSGLAMLSGTIAWAMTHFASVDDVSELRTEVHALYLKLIPENERSQ